MRREPAERQFTRMVPVRRVAAVCAVWLLGGWSGSVYAATPAPRPSSFFGVVTVAGEPVAAGTPVSAWVGGEPFAETGTLVVDGESVFRLDVPGDVPETVGIEGGVEGQEVVFKIGNAEAPARGVWAGGTVARVDLAAAAGPDLAVSKDDGETVVSPGQVLTYSITVTNLGPGPATGIVLEDPVPVGTLFVSASDGGAASGGLVTWPAFDLAEGASVSRTLTVEVAGSFPPGTTEIVNTATVLDDGANGVDPDLANNSATDADALAGGPDVVVTKTSDLAGALPGADLTYTLTLENRGFQDALDAVLTDTLPPEVTFLSASDDGRGEDGVVTWPAVDVPQGAVLTRTVRVRIAEELAPELTELVNTADAPVSGDLAPSDNTVVHLLPVVREPDVAVLSVDASGAAADPQSLAVAGTVAVELASLGTSDAAGFDVAIFEDRDGDQAFTAAADNLLGTAAVAFLGQGETAVVPVPVSGSLLFRDNRLFAFADSGEVLAELDETNNLDHSARACESVPTPEDFSPVVELSWPLPDTVDDFSADSLSTPLVVQLTDDDGDGRLDEGDVPDLVFVTYDLSNPGNPAPRLRAIRGDTGATIWDALPPISGFSQTFALTGAAAGDLDLDGRPEIVVSTFDVQSPTGRPNRIAAFEHTGALKWVSPRYSTHPDGDSVTNRDNPSIADLDGDGRPEIVVGANVFNADGSLRWAGTGGQGYQSARNDDGFDSGAISIVADLDLDGSPEVVTGNTAYRADGTILWQIPFDDGYPAVGDFDADDLPEIAVVSRGNLRLHEHDGTLIWTAELPGAGAEAGGAPTVADFDGDSAPEIGVAGSTQYAVFESDGTVRWQAPTQDGSSNMTGSTVFDLDGDGRFEVIYRDETALRIYRGEDGVVLYELPLSSITLNEQPVVADVDRDGNAEIVVTSDLADGVSVPVRTRGLRVIGDAADHWVAARPVWNQHAYHVTNVADDGHTIPAVEDPSWLAHNTYRANLPPRAGAFASPDLSASFLRVDVASHPQVTATVRIGNGGAAPVPAGVPVAFFDGDPAAGAALLGVAATSRALDPGAYEDMVFGFTSDAFGPAELFAAADDDGSGGAAGQLAECDEANNLHGAAYDTDVLGLVLGLADGTDSVQPGETFTYTLTVANAGAADRTGIGLVATVPEHTVFLSASDGGTEAAGEVTWPTFSLPALSSATRTLTLRVDEAIPLEVRELTTTATVTDDGSAGPDPTPSNNTAADTNRVLTVRADAGGPYAGDEGSPIAFDGSASSDRDGSIVAYEWDFDGDGVFDSAGVTASHAFPDDGVFPVALRVTDDSGEQDVDTALVTVSNLPPAVEAGPDRTITEGDALTLTATAFTDPGAADTHTATIDWGDGTATAGVVDQATGTVTGGHDYPDDGLFPVEVCVTDDDGATACDAFTVTVENAPPVVIEPGDVDLHTWQAEHWTHTGHPNTPNWVVSSDGLSVIQTQNAPASVFYGDFPAFGTRVQGRIRVETSRDDDYIGFALGYDPGDVDNPDADFLLLDWKQRDQGEGRAGLAVSRVTGAEPNLGSHVGDTIEELARGIRFGSTGWEDFREYEFTMDFTPGRLRVFVDGELEIDVVGSFSGGRLAFYNASQGRVRYRAFSVESLVADEGQPLSFSAAFGDLGLLDTHTATVDWGDGTLEPATVDQDSGFGTVRAEHVYPDDAAVDVEVCVTDDDGGTGCGAFPAVVNNLLPVVEAGGDRLAYVGEGLDVVAPYTDGGLLDTHTATIDWGDGTLEAVPADTVDGAGTVTGGHAYADEGVYAVEVCVTDDDGGTGCDRFEVTWLVPVVDLAVTKRADVRAVRPGEEVRYDLFVVNEGTREPEGVVVTDTLPESLDFVEASGGVYDAASRTVTWELPILPFQGREHFEVTVRAQNTLPFGAPAVNTATVTDDGRFGPDDDPADNETSATVLLWDGATPIVVARPPINLSRTADVFAEASSEGGLSVSVSRVIDGSLNTSWFSECGDSANQGGAPWAEVVLPRDATVHELRVFGNRQSSTGRDIRAGFFQLFDAEGVELFHSGELALPAPVRDLAQEIPTTAGVRRARFTSTDDESCNPGLAELEVVGFYGDAQGDTIPEGGSLDLDSVFFDSDPTEGHTATIDWGDGTVEPGALAQSGGDGTVDGFHVYPEDGTFTVEVCVTDDAGNVGCDTIPLTVENVAPSVNQGEIDLRLWHPEVFDHIDHPNHPNWVVAADGKSVIQTRNAPPSVFIGDFPAFGTRITGRIVVETSTDDDYIGFVLGYEPGDHASPDADFLLVDWKQQDQGPGRRGLAVSRVRGVALDLQTRPSEGIEELARGINLARVGWEDRREYAFTFEFNEDRLRVFVDGVLELDVTGSFSNGRLAFFNYSQERVRYRAFEVESLVLDEGGTTELLANYSDPGVLDTHGATVDWRDGSPVETVPIDSTDGAGFVTASHRYLEDALYQARVCVTDDEEATGCGDFAVLVRNLPPTVEAGQDLEGFVGFPVSLAGAAFSDAGILDTHTAAVAWGDGSTAPGDVTEEEGAGTVTASHVYAAPGTYAAELCVTDDDGGTGCDSVQVLVIERPPEVAIGDATVDEGDDGTVQADFPVTLSFPAPAPLTVSYATADGTARAGEDFLGTSGTLTIPAGASSGSIGIEVLGDRLDELDETFRVVLTANPPVVVLDGEGQGTIVDDDTAAISVGDATVEEGDEGTTGAVFAVTLATEADREIGVSYATVEDTATEGVDYRAASGSLAFAAGETEATLTVQVVGDRVLEPEEELFVLELSDPVEAPIADGEGLGTILDDERCPGPNLLANPGAEARPVDGEIPGWTEVEGTDWQWWRGAVPPALEGVASFLAGRPAETDLAELAQDVELSAYADHIASGGQRFAFEGFVRTSEEAPPDVGRIVVEYRDAAGLVLDAFDSGEMTSPAGWLRVADERAAPPATVSVRVRLLANRFSGEEADAFFDGLSFRSLRAPALSIGDVTVFEGDAGTTPALFPVSLSCPYYQEVTAAFATADGTALAGEDYLATSGVVTFPSGTTEEAVPVAVLGDPVDEPHETFLVELSDATPAGEAVLADPVGVGTIFNEDWCPRTRGYWKNHVEDWPVTFLVLGGVEYDEAGVLALLRSGGPDASTRLASHLAATKLNLARGGRDRETVLPTVDAADAFLELFPPGSGLRGPDRQEANRLKDELDRYNNGRCAED